MPSHFDLLALPFQNISDFETSSFATSSFEALVPTIPVLTTLAVLKLALLNRTRIEYASIFPGDVISVLVNVRVSVFIGILRF